MYPFTFLICVLVAPYYPSSAEVFNNRNNARLIQAAAIPKNGAYVFTNVATGQVIQHDRQNGVPNVYTSKIRQRKSHHSRLPELSLRSQQAGTKWISIRTPGAADGTKCISAQWGYHTEGGADHVGTLYECAVDPLNLAASLEKTKQWWLLMPIATAHRLEVPSNSAKSRYLSSPDNAKDLDFGSEIDVSRIVSQSKKSIISMPFWNTKTNRMEPLPAWKYAKRQLNEPENPDEKDQQSHDPEGDADEEEDEDQDMGIDEEDSDQASKNSMERRLVHHHFKSPRHSTATRNHRGSAHSTSSLLTIFMTWRQEFGLHSHRRPLVSSA